ncbi:hypothetical protein [Fusobacterium ulcerans]|uniref:hypothetical protein n=1 Tax=Fusobacterium ulcerans TaxID=861 RepID=UPI0030B4EFE3
MNWGIFDKYLLNDEKKLGECIQNYKSNRIVYREEIDGKIYYIKKYIMKKKDSFFCNLGIKNDLAKHYEKISKELKRINVLHVEPEYISVRSKNIFQRTAILVMKDGGITLESYIKNYEIEQEYFKIFFNLFVKLCQNKIYSRDYNLEGALLGKDGELRLIDFDKYRIKRIVTKKFKKKLIENLKENYLYKNRDINFENFLKKEIDRVIKELGWEKDIE